MIVALASREWRGQGGSEEDFAELTSTSRRCHKEMPTVSRSASIAHVLCPVKPYSPGKSLRTAFSVLSRPSPNYEGHVPLTRTERVSLALGSGFMALMNPRRGGTCVDSSGLSSSA